MDIEEKQALLVAVNLLITSPEAHQLLEAVENVSRVASRHPIALTGAAADMNALLRLKVSDADAYARVIELAEKRRADMGYEPLRKPEEPGYDKVEYMRQFMAQKRDRQRLAVEIENLRRSERDQLKGHARLEFMRRQSLRWKEMRDAFLERTRKQLGVESLNREQHQAALAQFWQTVDDELELRHKAAKEALLTPSGQRVKPEVPLDVLLAALKFDPYKK